MVVKSDENFMTKILLFKLFIIEIYTINKLLRTK